MVSISGGISHAAFGGIGLGYYLGIDPLLGAVWATGMAIGILFIAITPGYAPDLFSFLFGNILLVPGTDLILMGVLVTVIVVLVFLLYTQLMAVTFDEEYATVMNLRVQALSLLLLGLVALTVVMLIRVVGIILVIALLTLPAAISREYTTRLIPMMAWAVVLGIAFSIGGIWLSALFDIPSGATIIPLAAVVYGIVLIGKQVPRRRRSAEG